MADQGSIGRYKEMPTTAGHTTYPAVKHYNILTGLWQTENITVETYNYSNDNLIKRLQFGYRDYPIVQLNSREDGSISGTVTENGTPISNVRVVLLHRQQQEVIMKDSKWTDASGNYTFTNLDPTKLYTVMVLDKDGGTTYNDIIKSQITPVT